MQWPLQRASASQRLGGANAPVSLSVTFPHDSHNPNTSHGTPARPCPFPLHVHLHCQHQHLPAHVAVMASTQLTSAFRKAGLNYLEVLNVQTSALRNVLKEPMRSQVMSRTTYQFRQFTYEQGVESPASACCELLSAAYVGRDMLNMISPRSCRDERAGCRWQVDGGPGSAVTKRWCHAHAQGVDVRGKHPPIQPAKCICHQTTQCAKLPLCELHVVLL